MQSLNGQLIFSATDLSHFVACRHLTLLSRHTALGGPKPRHFDPALAVLRQRGIEHEQRCRPPTRSTCLVAADARVTRM